MRVGGPSRLDLDSPTSSTGVHLPTPGRAETGAASKSSKRTVSPPAKPSKEQAARQRQLESLLALPERIVRVGGGFERVPYGVEELLQAAVTAVVQTHGESAYEKAELCDALGYALAEADEVRVAPRGAHALCLFHARAVPPHRRAMPHE